VTGFLRRPLSQPRYFRWGFVAVALASAVCGPALAATEPMTIFDGGAVPRIAVDKAGGTPLVNAGKMLSHDIAQLTGAAPGVQLGMSRPASDEIVIGLATSPGVARLLSESHISTSPIKGKWETYGRAVVPVPGHPDHRALVIFGSDVRGAIWGVVDLTREMGVSAWQWWADVKIRKVNKLTIDSALRYSKPPSVKYRGIFLNAGDNGLNPWAGKTFDPAFGNIGPKTYAKIYQLMWRLKANTIWPAMTNADAAFNQTPGDAETAADYAIIRGTSHVEMLLRDNPHEWDEKAMGPYNWLTNRQRMIDYWRSAVAKFGKYENLYTVGLRGADDFPMEGVNTPTQMAGVLSDVIAAQREILSSTLHKPASEIPQLFTPYKEVLTAYNTGKIKLPSDITLDWPDDNFGYLMQLSNHVEQQRSGGAGVYYHLTFWGRPMSYLWLGSTDPSLIWEEMSKSYHFGARRFWIINVGSIKPSEFLTDFYLSMAFDIDRFKDPSSVRGFLDQWVEQNFGRKYSSEISDILWQYYKLAFDRNPEFMGWTTTFPQTSIKHTEFNMIDFGDENARRADAYRSMEQQAAALMKEMPLDRQAAFYQLVQYPIDTAANFNIQQLDLDKSITYGLQHRASANVYAEKSNAAHQRLLSDAQYYNDTVADRKWRNMIGTKPLDLPIYEAPHVPTWSTTGNQRCGIQTEGGGYFDGKGWWMPTLPLFHRELPRQSYFDLFLEKPADATWSADPQEPWIRVNKTTGSFSDADKHFDQRVEVSIDWSKAPKSGEGTIAVKCSAVKQPMAVHVRIAPPVRGAASASFIEASGIVSMAASHADAMQGNWHVLTGLGHSGADVQSDLDLPPIDPERPGDFTRAPKETFRFATAAPDTNYAFPVNLTDETAVIKVFALPTFPVPGSHGVRIAVSLDGNNPKVIDLAAAEFSAKWRAGVLKNETSATTSEVLIRPGPHRLTIYALDPGVTLDRIEVHFTGAPTSYGPVPETRIARAE